MSDPVIRPTSIFPILTAVAMLLMLEAPSQAQADGARAQTRATAPASVMPGAEAYYQWVAGCLDALEKDLPSITASAEAAAQAYVQDGWGIGVWGDAGIVGEFNGRAGGLMRTSQPRDIERVGWKGIVLFFPRQSSLKEDLARYSEFHRQGKVVLVFGDDLLRKSRDPKADWNAFIPTHAWPTGGLFATGSAGHVVPTAPVASIAALWTWTGEFVGALTRLGKMPTMHQSIMVPGALPRMERYNRLKFHAEAPRKVEAGQLGREYLSELRKCLAAVHEKDMGAIAQVAEQAAGALKAGHQAHVFAHGHAIRYHVAIPHDAGYFHQVNRGLFELKDDPGIAKGDFVFCVGYDRIFQGWYFEDSTTRLRSAGASLAWSMTDYNQDANIGPAAVPKGEIIIGQHWALGDAVAAVPGYDVKILPPSGVIAEAVFRMTEAEMLRILGPDSPAKYRAPASRPPARP